MAYYITEEIQSFPHPFLADEDGLLLLGGSISPEKMLLAYSYGIFPWYNEDSPVMWWFTHPRFVLFPEKLKIRKSMRRYFNKEIFRCTMNKHFDIVLDHCKSVSRSDQESTWITDELQICLQKLHKMGYAHSVEVWQGDQLVGGLYGLAIGKIFYGESMFSLVPDASKFGFITLVQWLDSQGFQLIDCQQETQHLATFGAEMIPKESFMQYLKDNFKEKPMDIAWKFSV